MDERVGRPARGRRPGAAFGVGVGLWVSMLVAGCVSSLDYSSMRAERDLLESENEQLLERLDATRERADKLAAELDQRRAEIRELRTTYDALVADLEAELATGEVVIEQLREGGLRLELAESILFAAGSADLGNEGTAVLRRVAGTLRTSGGRVVVEGHTDDRPIGGGLTRRYPTNWELAGARAARVVRLFADEGIDPARLEASSHADTRPVASNATPEGRARNRRIEIRLVPEAGA